MVHMHHIQKTRWGNPPCLSAGGCPLLGLEKKSLPGWVPCAATFWPAIKGTFWDDWETAVFGQILTGSRLEPDCGNLEASRPAIKRAFWDDWERAVFGQILTGSLFKPDFGNLEASRPASTRAFWDYLETAVFEPNPGREPFGARFWQFAGFPAAIKGAF